MRNASEKCDPSCCDRLQKRHDEMLELWAEMLYLDLIFSRMPRSTIWNVVNTTVTDDDPIINHEEQAELPR